MPASAERSAAASATVRAIGPGVSCECATGITPERLTRPRVGLIPTMPLIEDGQMMDPSVSVPIATAHRLAETATPEPELDPHGLRLGAKGFRHWPPRALHPLVERSERKFAHSDRFALPRITAPASRLRSTTNASRAG